MTTDIRSGVSAPITFTKPKARKRKKAPATCQVDEMQLQSVICSVWDNMIDAGASFDFAGDMNAGRRSAYERAVAVSTGMKAGEPDLRVYLPRARIVLVELKRKKGGRVSKEQKERHTRLRALGFEVIIVKLETTAEAKAWAREFISNALSPADDT